MNLKIAKYDRFTRHTEQCLQSFILQYFGEEPKEDCGRCGNCTDNRESIDVTRESQMVLSCMIRTNRFGKQMIAQESTGSRVKKVIEFHLSYFTNVWAFIEP